MTLPQRKLRELVFLCLYSLDFVPEEGEARIPLIMKELKVSRRYVADAEVLARRVLDVQQEIDLKIVGISLSYDFKRIPSVERNILRLAIYEMFYDKEIPEKVAIAEALRLTGKFSTPQAVSFVNAILDAIYKQSLGENVDKEEVEKIDDLFHKSTETEI